MALHHHNFTAAPFTGGGFYYGPGPAGYHHLPPAPPPPPLARAFQPPPPPVTAPPAPRHAPPAPRHAPPAPTTPRYTRVNAGSGSKTSVHAVIDYDDDFGDEDYYDDVADPRRRPPQPTVTPIQGPILVKNGSVPVVPLYSYPTVNNGSLVQIPIWWTALSLALGLEIRGDVIRGVPCIKRFHQLFCPTAGNSYPIERIELFIDENKALMKRMYGEFQMTTEYGPPSRELFEGQRGQRKARGAAADQGGGGGGKSEGGGAAPGLSPLAEEGESYFAKLRHTRQSFRNNQSSDTGRVDACESKVEIVTPYWAANSAGKIRAIVNTQHFEQAIHQEVCSKTQTNRCSTDCGCEQKYKWHRLLAYDPDNDCKGIFMDWFLFPSCCVCRCSPNANTNANANSNNNNFRPNN
ncbi:protein spaetzle 3 [Nilaparvata lugens]|uniref:protein spaetzle 3 n=1 Tax=Nilaparvata lugens TaxID=108931 RepID=UPI00193D5E47|nr:protein spaetzle 3 [Nilaparvata lugens]